MNKKDYQFTRQNQLICSVPCGNSSWMVSAKHFVICASWCSWACRVWPAGVAVQVLSFLTTFSRTRKWLKSMGTVWSNTQDLWRVFSAAIPIVLPCSAQCFWLSVGLWVCFLGFFLCPTVFTSSPNKLIKDVSESYLRCVSQLWLLIWIVATLFAIRAFCASKLQFWACFDLRIVGFFHFCSTAWLKLMAFFDTGSYLKFFFVFWDFLLIHIYLWFTGLCFL